ncbi:hypothetical protein DPMN_177309 [Dreissena polymorpha]|uniref:Uncharacterized protein n=1 Tax=Dreissena polymorpha TaxID=45954 RepID=A0A9D4E8I9_DREPO|nr:hypothetical protein DPMN_177309 [Dreissena polymorpha]
MTSLCQKIKRGEAVAKKVDPSLVIPLPKRHYHDARECLHHKLDGQTIMEQIFNCKAIM